ncbi:MAG: hypothetical protein LBS91_00705 [Clostridiales Family XIII bacterium]|nr:hypothetical protein [Clostridiales Family XIII bacterium]
MRRELPEGLALSLDEIAGFPEAVIGRMAPIQTEAMKDGDPLRISVEKYAFLPVDKAAFRGDAPSVEGLCTLDRFEYYVKRKLYVHNLGHAAVAYLGLLKGCTYIAEAVDDADILFLAAGAMRESAAALAMENAGDAANLGRHIDNLLYRFSNRALGDTCARVAADPARKLSQGDRLVGALENCEKYGLPAVYIAAAVAAALPALGFPGAASLEEITGLSPDGQHYRAIMAFWETVSGADAGGAAAALRRAAGRLAGDITIL